MPSNPVFDVKKNINHSPHVVILGAGASLASFPKGDRLGRKLPSMNNLIEVLGLNLLIAEHGVEYNESNFETWYDKLVSEDKYPKLRAELEERIESYFEYMRLPDEPTIYDYLILSLRNKDIIATFNWDPFLSQAFARNKDAIGYENLPKFVHLHGNVTIGICYQCKSKGWKYNKCTKCNKNFSPSKLLYPVSNKDYTSDDFLFGEWKELTENYLKHAYFFTIFGYSAPKTDIEARRLLLEAWDKVASGSQTMMSIVDVKPQDEIKNNWGDFIVKYDNCMIEDDFFNSYLARHPRRSCEAWAMATLQQDPWKENRFPRNITLKQLQNWVLQLVEEEKSGILNNKICDLVYEK